MIGDLMTRDERLARFDMLRAEGRITRKTWTGHDAQGRETACILAALAPECGNASIASVCPAEMMPAWMAHLTPWIDDAGSEAVWPGVVERYASLAHRWHVLKTDDWRTLDYRVRGLCVREAMRHTTAAKALAVCETVASLCETAGSGGTVGKEQWAEAAR